MIFPASKVFVVLYSSGGTADVGRHAVRAALDAFDGQVRVLTKNPATLLEETDWNSGSGPHTFTTEERSRLDVRAVDFKTCDDLSPHLDDCGGIVSALGNRQPFFGDRVGEVGTTKLIQAMEKRGVERLVAITSVGLNEDWPPMEFHWAGIPLKWIFRIGRTNYSDLNKAEQAIRKSDKVDYLLVRPVGLGEERRPKNEWFIQETKHEGKLGPDMAKLDCARFAVQEVLNPTYHKRAVVIGSNWENFQMVEKYDDEVEQTTKK